MGDSPAGRRRLRRGDGRRARRERPTAIDYAHALKRVADEMFSDAEKIVLVQDDLNTRKPASLYQAFAPKEARPLTEGITRQSTEAGSIWPRANSASSPRNVSIAASATWKACTARSPLARQLFRCPCCQRRTLQSLL